MAKMATGNAKWLQRPIKGVLLDITGVLYDSGLNSDGTAITGSIDAVQRLQKSKIPVRFCSNETQNTRVNLVAKLNRLGFDLKEHQVFTPAPATAKWLRAKNLRPFLLVHPRVLPEFDGLSTADPNCVVLGDAAEYFTYERVNDAFRLLMSLKDPILVSMGNGKFYKEDGKLNIDVGAFTKALEYACDIKSTLIGKPSREFFDAPLGDMGVTVDEAVMIGDDLFGDVKGAQSCGLRAVQVRTGKFRPDWESHAEVVPDGICNNLAEAIDLLLATHNSS